ncbi:hypothetical protein JCM10207_009300 [Rhodosporidiobolus poonsookiae]
MEPQCTIGPEDHLSRLPAELLAWIFELAYEDNHTTTGPLSRALLPFDRIERFKVVEVRSRRQPARLLELLRHVEEGYPNEPFSALRLRLPNLTSLIVEARSNAVPAAVLASACPSLTHFHLSDHDMEPDFRRHLGHLPRTLERLTLKTITCFDDYSVPCDDFLPSFNQLKRLYLGEGIFSHEDLFVNLRRLPCLTYFTLGCGAIVDASSLLSFISGSTRHPSLKLLFLDMLNRGKSGYRLVEDGYGALSSNGSALTRRVDPEWLLPEFTGLREGRFSVEAVEQLVLAGTQNGVTVEGSAVEGTKFYREWMSEATECLLVWGQQECDFGELREFLGKEAAEQLLRQRGLQA